MVIQKRLERIVNMKIGTKLKQGRADKNLTQEEAAKILNVSRSTVSSWEVNRTYPDLEMLVTLSDLYDISLDSMLREDEKMVQTLTYEMNTGRKRSHWLSTLGALYVPLLIFSLLILLNIDELLRMFYVGGLNTISILNIGSLILGIVAWVLPGLSMLRVVKSDSSKLFMGISLGACATSISFQMLYNNVLVGTNDISALMDTNGFSTIISIILLVGTLLLNAISYFTVARTQGLVEVKNN